MHKYKGKDINMKMKFIIIPMVKLSNGNYMIDTGLPLNQGDITYNAELWFNANEFDVSCISIDGYNEDTGKVPWERNLSRDTISDIVRKLVN